MRILILSYEYPPLGGGGGVAVAALAHAWADAGHRVTIVSSGTAQLPAYEQQGRLAIHRLPVPLRTARATASLTSLLVYPGLAVRFATQRWSPQQFDLVVSAFAIPSGVAGAVLARWWRLPHLVAVMGGDIYDPSKALSPHRLPLLKQTVALVLRTATKVVAPSQDVAQRAERVYGVRGVQVIPLGLPLPALVDGHKPEQIPQILTIARLVPRKLIDRLILAVAALPRGTARLVVLGDGPERQALTELITEQGLTEYVQLRGYVSEAEKLAALRAADVFALVSEHEGFGLVYLEAAAQALPIVAGTVGGQVDFLEHGRTGWLVEPKDVTHLSHALAALCSQGKLRRYMGNNACAVARNYHVRHTAPLYLHSLQQVGGATR